MLMINMVPVHNPLTPFCCVHGKDTYGIFPLVVLASSSESHFSIKLQADSNILASLEAGWGNYLPYVLAPPSLSCESEAKHRDKKKHDSNLKIENKF